MRYDGGREQAATLRILALFRARDFSVCHGLREMRSMVDCFGAGN